MNLKKKSESNIVMKSFGLAMSVLTALPAPLVSPVMAAMPDSMVGTPLGKNCSYHFGGERGWFGNGSGFQTDATKGGKPDYYIGGADGACHKLAGALNEVVEFGQIACRGAVNAPGFGSGNQNGGNGSGGYNNGNGGSWSNGGSQGGGNVVNGGTIYQNGGTIVVNGGTVNAQGGTVIVNGGTVNGGTIYTNGGNQNGNGNGNGSQNGGNQNGNAGSVNGDGNGSQNGGNQNGGNQNGGNQNGGNQNGGNQNGGNQNGGNQNGGNQNGGNQNGGNQNGGNQNGGNQNGGNQNGGNQNGGNQNGYPNGGYPNGGYPNGGYPNNGNGGQYTGGGCNSGYWTYNPGNSSGGAPYSSGGGSYYGGGQRPIPLPGSPCAQDYRASSAPLPIPACQGGAINSSGNPQLQVPYPGTYCAECEARRSGSSPCGGGAIDGTIRNVNPVITQINGQQQSQSQWQNQSQSQNSGGLAGYRGPATLQAAIDMYKSFRKRMYAGEFGEGGDCSRAMGNIDAHIYHLISELEDAQKKTPAGYAAPIVGGGYSTSGGNSQGGYSQNGGSQGGQQQQQQPQILTQSGNGNGNGTGNGNGNGGGNSPSISAPAPVPAPGALTRLANGGNDDSPSELRLQPPGPGAARPDGKPPRDQAPPAPAPRDERRPARQASTDPAAGEPRKPAVPRKPDPKAPPKSEMRTTLKQDYASDQPEQRRDAEAISNRNRINQRAKDKGLDPAAKREELLEAFLTKKDALDRESIDSGKSTLRDQVRKAGYDPDRMGDVLLENYLKNPSAGETKLQLQKDGDDEDQARESLRKKTGKEPTSDQVASEVDRLRAARDERNAQRAAKPKAKLNQPRRSTPALPPMTEAEMKQDCSTIENEELQARCEARKEAAKKAAEAPAASQDCDKIEDEVLKATCKARRQLDRVDALQK